MKKIVLVLTMMLVASVALGAGCQKSEKKPAESTPSASQPQASQPKPAEPETPTPPTPAPSVPATPTSTPAEPTPTTPTTPPAKGPKLNITQWGVSLVLSREIADTHYYLNKGNAYFTTKSLLTKGGEKCGAEYGPLGAMVRTKELKAEGPMAPPANAVKVGEYYYYYVGPQTPCTSDPTVQTLADKQAKLVEQAVPTVYQTE